MTPESDFTYRANASCVFFLCLWCLESDFFVRVFAVAWHFAGFAVRLTASPSPFTYMRYSTHVPGRLPRQKMHVLSSSLWSSQPWSLRTHLDACLRMPPCHASELESTLRNLCAPGQRTRVQSWSRHRYSAWSRPCVAISPSSWFPVPAEGWSTRTWIVDFLSARIAHQSSTDIVTCPSSNSSQYWV